MSVVSCTQGIVTVGVTVTDITAEIYSLFCWKLKTENWKHYSKIIFKCVNSIVGPIFNIFKYLNSTATIHKQYYYSTATVIIAPWPKAKRMKWGEKKNLEKRNAGFSGKRWIQTGTLFLNLYFSLIWLKSISILFKKYVTWDHPDLKLYIYIYIYIIILKNLFVYPSKKIVNTLSFFMPIKLNFAL